MANTGRASRGQGRHLQLVHSRRPLLTVAQLAMFETPRTWAEIATLDPTMKMHRWREGIADADEYGFGFLHFVPVPSTDGRSRKHRGTRTPRRSRAGTWQLTDEGRAYVARMTRTS